MWSNKTKKIFLVLLLRAKRSAFATEKTNGQRAKVQDLAERYSEARFYSHSEALRVSEAL